MLRTGTPAPAPSPPSVPIDGAVIPPESETEEIAEEDIRAREVAKLREEEREHEIEKPCIFKSISPVRTSL